MQLTTLQTRYKSRIQLEDELDCVERLRNVKLTFDILVWKLRRNLTCSETEGREPQGMKIFAFYFYKCYCISCLYNYSYQNTVHTFELYILT